MVVCATRFPPALLACLEELARTDLPIAEINRRVGARAEELGVARPSYDRVRQLVHLAEAEALVPGWSELAVDVAFRHRPPDALLDKAAGTWPLPEDAGLRPRRRSRR